MVDHPIRRSDRSPARHARQHRQLGTWRRVRSIFFGQAAAAPAFDQQPPDCLNRFPRCNCRRFRDAGSDRHGSQRIRSLSASWVRMQGGEGPMRSRDGLAGSERRSREIEGESARTAAGRAGHGRAGLESRPAAGPFKRVGGVLSAFPAQRLSGEPHEEIQRGVLRLADLIGIAGRKPCVREPGALRGCGRGRRWSGVGRRVRRDGRGERQGGDESGKGLHCSYPFNFDVSFQVGHPVSYHISSCKETI